MTVFVPGIGFRSAEGVGIREPVTERKADGRGLKVTRLVSTDQGTEVAFEARDPERERACTTGKIDYQWASRCEVRLRDVAGEYLKSIPGPGNASSMGQHEFGFFGRKAMFEALRPHTDRVTLELRGELGAWDVPLDLVALPDAGALPVIPIRAEQARSGVTVRVLGVALTDETIVIDVEADAGPKVTAIEIGEWLVNHGRDHFVLIDDEGRRLEEPSIRDRMEMRRVSGRTVVTFPRTDARTLTLVVPAIVFQECEATLEFDLPVYAPVDLDFGRYRAQIRFASAVDELAAVPGEDARPGIEVQMGSDDWLDGRRVLRPGRILVDGAFHGYQITTRAEPGRVNVNIAMPDATSARRITMHDPVVAVRGPWEIRFSLP